MKSSNIDRISVLPADPHLFSDEEPLSGWVNLLQHCNYINDCADLYNKHMALWNIGNRYSPECIQQKTYGYKYKELLLEL